MKHWKNLLGVFFVSACVSREEYRPDGLCDAAGCTLPMTSFWTVREDPTSPINEEYCQRHTVEIAFGEEWEEVCR